MIDLEVWDTYQRKWVDSSKDTSTNDNIYRMEPKEREFWDKCNKIASDSHKGVK